LVLEDSEVRSVRNKIRNLVGAGAIIAASVVLLAVAMASGIQSPGTSDNADTMTDPYAPGMKYQVVYKTADGAIVALHIFAPSPPYYPGYERDEALVDVTNDPNRPQYFADVTNGLAVWKINTETLSLEHT
jgi:hypothetical protein